MKKSIIVLLVLAILAGIGLTSCKNEIQAPVDELVSISFGYDSSRALTASLQEFKVNDYYWFYESEKADGSGLKSGQTGAGLTNLTDDDAMEAVLANIRPANGGAIGLGEPVKGFSKGLWNFRLFAATVEVENNVNYFHPVYIGEARNVLIDNDNHTVKVVVSPFSAEFQLDGEYGNLKIGQIDFKEASSESTVVPGALTITDMVSSNDSGNWVEVSHTPDHNETENFDYFKLPAGTYLYTRVYSYNGSEITRGSVIVTVYPNLTTTVSGFVTELTTSFNFETTENPDAVNVSAEATIVYGNDENLPTSGKYSLAVDGQAVSKVEAEITKTAADSLIEQLTNTFKQTDTSMANINLGTTSTSMDLNLGVRTTATTASSVVYDINMTAVVTYDGGSDPAIVKETDVKSVPDYVTVTVDMQSGLSSVSVTHSGHDMIAVENIVTAGTGAEGAAVDNYIEAEELYVGFYKYDTTTNKLYIKTKSFSPFVVSYEYATSAPMAKVIRYVYDKTNETVMDSATITSAAKETLDYQTDMNRVVAILGESVLGSQTYADELAYTALTGTLVTFMPRVNAYNLTVAGLQESDKFYSGNHIYSIVDEDGIIDFSLLEKKSDNAWRAEFKITSDYSFSANELSLIGSYFSLCVEYPLDSEWGASTNTPAIYVMKDSGYSGLADYITYDLLLGLCSNEDESVRPGFTCGASLGLAATAATLGKTIKVQLILTNDNFQEVKDDPTKRVEVVCAEVVTGFRPATMGDDVTVSYGDKDLFTASLQEFAQLVNGDYQYSVGGVFYSFDPFSFAGCTVTLNHDVDLENVEWTPIGNEEHPFSGVFDGQGYTISNFNVTDVDYYAALFGYVVGQANTEYDEYSDIWENNALNETHIAESRYTAVIKNVIISGANCVSAKKFAAGLVAFANNVYLYNCSVANSIIQTGKVAGGLAAALNGSVIKGCQSYASNVVTVTGYHASGLVGYLSYYDADNQYPNPCMPSAVINCTNSANLDCSNSAGNGGCFGGILAGVNNTQTTDIPSAVINCVNNGNIIISGGNYYSQVGGIVGSGQGISILAGCLNTGAITLSSSTGSNLVSGIVASMTGGTPNGRLGLYNCENRGSVSAIATSNSNYVAGIIASANNSLFTIDGCLNTGSISCKDANEENIGYVSTILSQIYQASTVVYKNMEYADLTALSNALPQHYGAISKTGSITIDSSIVVDDKSGILELGYIRRIVAYDGLCTQFRFKGTVPGTSYDIRSSYVDIPNAKLIIGNNETFTCSVLALEADGMGIINDGTFRGGVELFGDEVSVTNNGTFEANNGNQICLYGATGTVINNGNFGTGFGIELKSAGEFTVVGATPWANSDGFTVTKDGNVYTVVAK